MQSLVSFPLDILEKIKESLIMWVEPQAPTMRRGASSDLSGMRCACLIGFRRVELLLWLIEESASLCPQRIVTERWGLGRLGHVRSNYAN